MIEFIRQNGAPSGLENRGLDARFAFTTKQGLTKPLQLFVSIK
ncbi:hypothetical protein [Leptospira sp. mild_001]|nr:hypothetical protein [Leptospira sp. mild_001]